MAKEDEKKPTAAAKGKGKAVDAGAEKGKDAKADAEDKKGAAASTGGMLLSKETLIIRHALMIAYRGAQRRRPTA